MPSRAREQAGRSLQSGPGQADVADAADTSSQQTAGPVPAQVRRGDHDTIRLSERIRQRLGSLSPSERKVARVLLSGRPTIGLESSARLAEHAGVSVPTVSRFVAELGFDNYAAFQRTLHDEISVRMMTPVEVYRRHQAEQRSADLLGTSARILGEAVTASVADLDAEEFRRAVELLAHGSRQVFTVGGWFSQLLARYLSSVLRELRPGVRLVGSSPSDRAGVIADIARGDVIAAFDFRRYELDTLQVARSAREAGARIVLLTDPWLSPVADIADAVLTARVTGSAPFESLTAAFAVVETLIAAMVDALGDAGRARFERFDVMAEQWVRPWSNGSRETREVSDPAAQ